MVRTNPQSTRDAQHKKPAQIHLINGETIVAPDHDTNNNWCIIYKSVTTGIAKKIPRESILYIDREVGNTSINNGSSESHDIDTINERKYDTWWNGNEWRRVSTDDVTGEVALEREVKQIKIAPEDDIKPLYADRFDDKCEYEAAGETTNDHVLDSSTWSFVIFCLSNIRGDDDGQ